MNLMQRPSAVEEMFARRDEPVERLAAGAEAVTRASYAMALRFRRGGKLIVFGNGGASTDAQHVAVEFVHPVIVGKPALPAMALTSDIATVTGMANQAGYAGAFAHQLRLFAEPVDIALGISPGGDCESVLRGLEAAHEQGLLTVALIGGDGGAIGASPAVTHPLLAHSADPLIVKEIQVTTYHLIWEQVHSCLDHGTAR